MPATNWFSHATVVTVTCAFACGCNPESSALFEVDGVDGEYSDCFAEVFPFEPVFHAYRERAGTAGLFFQSRGGNFQFVDVITFEIFNPDQLALNTAIPLEPVVTPQSKMTAVMELTETCPDLAYQPQIEGTVTFEQFEQESRGRIIGTVNGQLLHPLTLEVAASSFSGSFDFVVQQGQPYEEFRN